MSDPLGISQKNTCIGKNPTKIKKIKLFKNMNTSGKNLPSAPEGAHFT